VLPPGLGRGLALLSYGVPCVVNKLRGTCLLLVWAVEGLGLSVGPRGVGGLGLGKANKKLRAFLRFGLRQALDKKRWREGRSRWARVVAAKGFRLISQLKAQQLGYYSRSQG